MTTKLTEDIIKRAKLRTKPMKIAHELGCSVTRVYDVIRKARKSGETIPLFRQPAVEGTKVPIRIPENLHKLLENYAETKGIFPNEAAKILLEDALVNGGSSHV